MYAIHLIGEKTKEQKKSFETLFVHLLSIYIRTVSSQLFRSCGRFVSFMAGLGLKLQDVTILIGLAQTGAF